MTADFHGDALTNSNAAEVAYSSPAEVVQEKTRAACGVPGTLPCLTVFDNRLAITGENEIVRTLALAASGEEFLNLLRHNYDSPAGVLGVVEPDGLGGKIKLPNLEAL